MRTRSFGESDYRVLDALGNYLSRRRFIKDLQGLNGLSIADVGCGYRAPISRQLIGHAKSVSLFDVSIADGLKFTPSVTCYEGNLTENLEVIPKDTYDIILCISVLEHLIDDYLALSLMYSRLKPGGRLFLNVPNWIGKRALELAAFRFGLSPHEEISDHKNYYSIRDIWPLLIRVGFQPAKVKCGYHKLFLNTYAIAQK